MTGTTLPPPPLRLGFLDGVRGLAAVCVVVSHVAQIVAWPGAYASPPSWLMRLCLALMTLGPASVAVFIVLSGCCLMLPVARDAGGSLRGGIAGFLRRRATRILPPYYCAVAFSLLVLACVPDLRRVSGTWADHFIPAFAPGVLLSHAALVQNLRPAWEYKINGALWSVATEWQIYFVFGLFLLPILKRAGALPALAAAVALVLVPFRLLPPNHNLYFACPWMLVAFAVGMIAATLIILPTKKAILKFAFQIGLPCLVLSLLPDRMIPNQWAVMFRYDALVSLGTVAIILLAIRQTESSPPWSARKLLSVRPLVWIGTFSYSLYLTHYLTLVALRVYTPAHAPLTMLRLSLVAGVPLAVLFARLFYQFCEKPFLRSPRPAKTAIELPQSQV